MPQSTLHTVLVMAVCMCAASPSYTQSHLTATGAADLQGRDDRSLRSGINYTNTGNVSLNAARGNAGAGSDKIRLTNALPGSSSVHGEDGSSLKPDAATMLDGKTEVRVGQLSINGLASFDTGQDIANATTPDSGTQNNPGAGMNGSGPQPSVSMPGTVTIAGDVSLSEGHSYVVGIDGRGTTNDRGALTEHSVPNSHNFANSVVINRVSPNGHYNMIYGTNSIVLDLTSAAQGLNAAMYSDLNAASAGHGFDAFQPAATVGGSVGVYGFLHSFPDRNAQSAARAFQGIPNGLRSDMPAVNRLANRIVHKDLMAGFGNGHAVSADKLSTQKSTQKTAPSLRLWLEMTGSLTDTDSDVAASTPDSRSFAYYGGIDTNTYLLDRIGVSFGYSSTSMSPVSADSVTVDNYHALMYARDDYHGYDVSLAAGTAWSEYHSVGATGFPASSNSDDSREYSFTMDTEVRKEAEFGNYTLSGIGGVLTEYRRSFNINSDNQHSVFPGAGYDSQAAQLRLGGEIMRNDWFFMSDEIQISTHWLYEAGNSDAVTTNSYIQNLGWNSTTADSVINGIEFNAKYAFAISEDSHFSITYSAISDTENLSHQALASANLTW